MYTDPEEAKAVGDALRNFSKHHTIGVTDKKLSEIMLAVVGGSFVGTRLLALGKQYWPKAPARPLAPVLEMPRQQAAPEVPGRPQQQAPPQPEPPGREIAPSALNPLGASGDLEE